MTFGNSSSDKISLGSMNQWAIAMRRKWLLAIYILSAIIWYPVITVVKLTGDINRLGGLYPDVSLKSVMVHDFSSVIGFDNLSFLAVTLLAFITAIQGFAYLYRRQTVDFYESQPIKRSAMFAKLYINGLLMYLCTAAAGYLLAFIIARAMGVFRLALIAEALVEFVELFLLFLGIYSITVLGTVVSGTLIMGIMVSIFLLSAEAVVRGLVYICSQTYLATFYAAGFNVWNAVTSPFFTYMGTAERLGFRYTDDSVYRISSVIKHIQEAVAPDIRLLVIAVIATALAWIAYKNRKAESAGHSIVFPLVEWVVKFVCGVAACMLTGVMMDGVSQGAIAIVFLGIILTAFIICAVAEIVFESDFRAMFRKPWHIAVVAAAGIGIILGYRFDVTGYETYIPEVSKVESCAMFNTYGMGGNFYESDGTMLDAGEYFEKYMQLTDIEGVEDIARYGQQVKVEKDRTYRDLNIAHRNEETSEQSMSEMEYCWEKVVMYRMKSGKKVYRLLTLPEYTDPAMLDRVTKNAEYFMPLYNMNDDFINKVMETVDYSELLFNTGCIQQEGSGELYKGFAEAFKKDLEENYCFTLAYNSDPVGTVYYSPDYSVTSDQPTYYISYTVFPEYKNTVKFLEDNGLYTGKMLPEEDIDNITVYYDPNVYKPHYADQAYEYEEVREKEYTDPEHIKALMGAAHYDGEEWDWKSNNYLDYSCEVVVNIASHYKPDRYGNRGGTCTLFFRYDKVPDFVKKDLQIADK
ncbi:MAG: hypothetical protein J5966_07690 [Lachnospiraceae bacterium]|nr:hypothetical protein [Lachnospiraceae bacterium]